VNIAPAAVNVTTPEVVVNMPPITIAVDAKGPSRKRIMIENKAGQLVTGEITEIE